MPDHPRVYSGRTGSRRSLLRATEAHERTAPSCLVQNWMLRLVNRVRRVGRSQIVLRPRHDRHNGHRYRKKEERSLPIGILENCRMTLSDWVATKAGPASQR